MSRLEGKAKAGFYPTPANVADILCTLLAPPASGTVRALDPCCGEGVFLATITAALDAESYGIEINEERAARAATRLDQALCADALTARRQHEAFGLLLLNPPYDYDDEASRLEHAFLRATTPYLAPGGVLAFLVPQGRLAVSARFLAAWYEDLRLWRFPDPEYAAYRQVLLIARRRVVGQADPAAARRLVALGSTELAPLAAGCCRPYPVPGLGGPAPRLQAAALDPRAAMLAASSPWPALEERLWPLTPPRLQPLMPLKRGHVAQFGVAGLLDHCLLHDQDGRAYVVRGRSTKAVVTSEEEDDGNITRIEREVIQTAITLLDLRDGSCSEVTTGAEQAGALSLPAFLERFGGSITARILAEYPPLYTTAQRDLYAGTIARLGRRLRGAQADVVRATALALQQGRRAVFISGEMGTGKTCLSVAAARCAEAISVLVLCPPHLTRKWLREIQATVPGAQIGIAAQVRDLHRLLAMPASLRHPRFTIVSRERAKLSYAWRPAAIPRSRRTGCDGAPATVYCCPDCSAAQVDEEGVPLDESAFRATRRRCRHCAAALWQADPRGPRRVALADYITRHLRGAYDLLILDEVHEFKARGSAQGLAAASLAATIPRTIALTGTLFGGLATSLFHLLYRLLPDVRAEFAHDDELRWAARYGVIERTTRASKDRYTEDGAMSRRRTYVSRVRERPGITPELVVRLVSETAFLRLADVATDLPPYGEEVRLYPLHPAQAAAYARLAARLQAELLAALHAGGGTRLLGAYLQTLLAYPDTCWRAERVIVRGEDGERVLAEEAALDAGVIYPKERGLIDLVRAESGAGRRTLVYVSHTERRDVTARLAQLLRGSGIRVAVLKSDTVAAEAREAWVQARVQEGVQALICHPRCVQTGLDLLDFPTIVYQEIEYSTYVLRQASRRSWRIGQRQPVRVYFTAYEGTLQAQALALIAEKLRVSLLVDGELGEEGLATFADDGDFFRDLARTVANGERGMDQGGLEALFAAAQLAANLQEESLPPEETTPHPDRPALPPRTCVEPACLPLNDFRAAFAAGRGARRVAPGQRSLFDLPEADAG